MNTSVSITFFLSIGVIFLISVMMIYIWYIRFRIPLFKNLVFYITSILVAMMVLNAATAIDQLDDLFPQQFNINELLIYSVGYSIYFVFWLLGNQSFLKSVARLPARKVTSFRIIDRLLYLEILLSFVYMIFFSQIIFPIPEGSISDTIAKLVTVLIPFVAFVTFFYFYWILGNEKSLNNSKLVKARIALFQQAVLTQILMLPTIAVSVFILSFGLRSQVDMFLDVHLMTFSIVNLFTMLCALLVFWAIAIPKWIRTRFELSGEYYKSNN